MIRLTAMTHLFIRKGTAVAPFDQFNMNNGTLVLSKEHGRASAKNSSSAFDKFRISCKLFPGLRVTKVKSAIYQINDRTSISCPSPDRNHHFLNCLHHALPAHCQHSLHPPQHQQTLVSSARRNCQFSLRHQSRQNLRLVHLARPPQHRRALLLAQRLHDARDGSTLSRTPS